MGHRLVFAQFQNYDDEGYLLVTVQQYLQGLPLYDDVYTQYGPVYYMWQWVLHRLLQIPLTHDATRVITLVVWLAGSALASVPVWLLTKHAVFTAIGVAVAFFHLTQLTFEPGHPQELCLLGVMGVVAAAMWRLVRRRHLGIPTSVALGVLVALTVLTKVNVGAFLAGAVVLGLATSLRGSREKTVIVAVLAVAAVLAVPALMSRHLLRGDITAFVVIVWSALLAALVAGSRDRDAMGAVTARDVLAWAAGAAIAATGVVAATTALGTSWGALIDGLVVRPLELPGVFGGPPPVPWLAAVAAPVWPLVALCRQRGVPVVQRWLPSLTLALGLVLFLLSTVKAYGPLLAYGLPFAWLALGDASLDPSERAARRILVFAAVFAALQVYPMPGTQIVVGTVFLVPVALVAMVDAEREIRARRATPTAPRSFLRRAVLGTLAVAVAAILGIRVNDLYERGTPLGLPGARAVRTTEADAARYQWLSMNLREHCDRFLTAPGLNSLHFWTGIPPVSTFNTTAWQVLLDDEQQARVVAAAAPVERLCVVWHPLQMGFLPGAAATRPLFAWLVREFEPRACIGGWELRTRRGSDPTLVYQGRWLDDGGVVLELPPLGVDPVARITVVETGGARTLGSSEGGVAVADEDGADARISRGIDVSRRRRVTLRGVLPPSSPRAFVVARLWAANGRSLAVVPIETTRDNATCGEEPDLAPPRRR
jgi:hypothetical protein